MTALAIKALTKRYANGVVALDNFSLQVEPGEFLGLLGRNGAGKTTLIGILNSLVIKSSGKVSVFDCDIDQDHPGAKAYLGTVPQEFNFSIFERVINIVSNQAGYYGMSYRQARFRAHKYLSLLGLWEKRQHYAGSLSGGMKRRLMIARAMVHEPQLLILDEPTAGVDIELRRSMWDFLQVINNDNNVTILLTTHYLDEAEVLCDRIAIIEQGRLLADKNKIELIAELKKESFILDVNPDCIDTARSSMQESALDGVELTWLAGGSCQVDLSHDVSLNALFDALNHWGVEVTSLRNKSNRLEELFLIYTQGKGGKA